MDELQEFLAGQGKAPETDEGRQAWRIDNDDLAVWAFRKQAAALEEIGRARRLAAAEKSRVEAWLDTVLRGPQRDYDFFTSQLALYWRRELDEQIRPLMDQGMTFEQAWDKIKAKSRKLPTGTLEGRRTPGKIEVVDEAAFVAWCAENGHDELLRKAPAKDALGKLRVKDEESGTLVTEEGEAVVGVVFEPGHVEYSAKPTMATAT